MRDTERDQRERPAENETKTGREKVREFREAESQGRVCAQGMERERDRGASQAPLCPDCRLRQRASERLLE